MRSTVTNTLTSGRLSASSIRLPTYIEATKPQNTSGWSLTSVGPTETPCSIKAPISTAVIGLVGIPSASIGTKAPVDAELLADSGPATPRSEEHTSELQSLRHLVCRLLLEKKI